MVSSVFPRPARRAALIAAILAAALAASGCAQVREMIAGDEPATVATPTSSPTPEIPFDSEFSYEGSVSLSSSVGDELEIDLDVWAVDPRRTMEWSPNDEKVFGFAVNAVDNRVSERAVLTDKRRVYLSQVSITSATAQESGSSTSPFQFMADPRTLVPSDTLRSDRGLLLNTFQGGLLVPETPIQQLPADTIGITLNFALTVWVEGAANDDASFSQQTVYQSVPVAIFAEE
ncbi:fructose 1,6-bisphosphatase [Microbacterium limosum]|uniref:Fructose 1,6-bisphosphatase n=1 Tax=Microbacterium limosum TaxID=3079935 RepID=A0AAU0MFG1_9MICO|nr:fructose 1,6-bisphosphatase [Microbacterium sp. Y20]WOQ69201.1 fructose 1,6-bisphosphatase [Microbacterium sp. Y20]